MRASEVHSGPTENNKKQTKNRYGFVWGRQPVSKATTSLLFPSPLIAASPLHWTSNRRPPSTTLHSRTHIDSSTTDSQAISRHWIVPLHHAPYDRPFRPLHSNRRVTAGAAGRSIDRTHADAAGTEDLTATPNTDNAFPAFLPLRPLGCTIADPISAASAFRSLPQRGRPAPPFSLLLLRC